MISVEIKAKCLNAIKVRTCAHKLELLQNVQMVLNFSNNVGIDEKIPFECLLGLPLLRGLEVSSISETIDVTIFMNPGLDPAPSAVEKGSNR